MKKFVFKLRFPKEWGLEPVPKEGKTLRGIDIFVLWLSEGIGLLVIQAGAFLTLPPNLGGFGFSAKTAFLICLLGSILGSVVLSLGGVIGSKHGVTSMVSLRPAFGLLGSYLLSLVNVALCIGWTTFEIVIMGQAATSLSGSFLGSATKYFWFVLFAIFAYIMASSGPLTVVRQWLEKFAIWLALLGAILITYSLSNYVASVPAMNSMSDSSNLRSILLSLDLVIAQPVSWLPLISDYNRFARSESESFWGTFLGYTVANTWFYFIGALLAVSYPEQIITYSMVLLPLGFLGLLLILADEPDNAFADVYSASLSIQNIFPRLSQRKSALAITISSLLAACFIPIVRYENFLLLIGAAFVPVFGVMFSDFFVKHHANYTDRQLYPPSSNLRWQAVVSWIIGFMSYFYFSYVNTIFGATLPSLIISFVLYSVLSTVQS